MRSVIGVSLLALLAGCSDEDADGVFVTATWMFRSVEANTPQPCPESFPVVLLHARLADGGVCNADNDQLCTAPLDCALGTGTSDRLRHGVYEVWLDVTNADGSLVYASTVPETLDMTLGDKSYARQVVVDGGVFELGWTLRGSDGTPRTCEQAEVARIAISASNEADPSSATSDEIDCENGTGYSFPYAAGSYLVNIEAVNADGQTRGLADPLSGQVIVGPSGVTDLGVVDIQLSPLMP